MRPRAAPNPGAMGRAVELRSPAEAALIAAASAVAPAITIVDDPPPSRPVFPARRLSAIDIVRGTFMVIILAGHAASNLNYWPSSNALEDALGPFFQTGTVGFTVVSGTLLGSFAASRPDMGPILRRYRQQGIRLLLVAHPLIALALYLPLRRPENTFWEFLALRHYVTDLLAVLFLGLAPLVPKIKPRTRLWLGIAAMIGLRAVRATDFGRDGDWLILREIFGGTQPRAPRHVIIDNYAFLGILGMFLIGTYIGDTIGRARKTNTLDQAAKTLLRAAALIQILTVLLLGIWAAFKVGVLPDFEGHIRKAFYPERAGSFFPAYLGFVLALLAVALRRDASGAHLSPTERSIEVIGKTSLFSYVLQYVLVQTIPCLLGLEYRMNVWWVAGWTVVSMGLLVGGAMLWNRHVKKV